MGKASYTITLKNNQTENEALKYLLTTNKGFVHLSKEDRKKILELLKIDKKYARAFDLVHIPNYTISEKGIELRHTKDVTLIEMKTTRKKLPNNPRGFFFGATQNEFDLAKQLGKKFKFCFVSLHPESKSCAMLTLAELEKMIRTKRVQHQINLKNDHAA